MRISEKGLNLIKSREAFKSKPYLCPAGKPTIGYGMIIYPNGKAVTLQDKPLTESEADSMLRKLVMEYETGVNVYVRATLNQNQFDALTCFCYNIGVPRFAGSTLVKMVNKNPNDPLIRNKFMEWNKSDGKVLRGLTLRRDAEATLYFS